MNRFFGTSKPKPKATLESAITTADSRVEAIDLKLKKIEAELLRYKDQLKGLPEGPTKNRVKASAMRVLQQRNMYATQRDQIQAQVFSMEQAQFTTENLKNTMVTVQAMKDVGTNLRKEYKKIDVDTIEKLQDEMSDLMEESNYLQECLGQTFNNNVEELDEADLEAELNQLSAEMEVMDSGEIPSYLQDLPDTNLQNSLPEFADELPETEKPNTDNPMKAT